MKRVSIVDEQGHILVIKTSSLGDVVHTLPAVSDLKCHYPDLQIDWVVEEDFSFLPEMHPGIARVIPVAVRRWRKNLMSGSVRHEFGVFRKALRQTPYDLIVDAQGLLKSALISTLARGPVTGFDRHSVREPLASLFYSNGKAVAKGQHAVTRVRALFAAACAYQIPVTLPDYGIADGTSIQEHRLLFAHGTSWTSKLWPLHYWRKLAQIAGDHGYEIDLPWVGATEQHRAEMIAEQLDNVRVLSAMSLPALVDHMRNISGVISCDTGLGHIAAALGIPALAVYGPTDPLLTGIYGNYQQSLSVSQMACSPCFQKSCPLPQDPECFPPCFRIADLETIWVKLHSEMDARDKALC